MSSTQLDNLARIRRLDPVPDNPKLARDKLAQARAKLDDSSVASISKATRYECAYAAIREIAELGLLLHGYRTSKSQAGHHQTAIQCLAHTLDVDDKTIRVLDRLRKQRNDAGYEAEPVTDGELSECVHQARQLMPRIEQSLKVKGWI